MNERGDREAFINPEQQQLWDMVTYLVRKGHVRSVELTGGLALSSTAWETQKKQERAIQFEIDELQQEQDRYLAHVEKAEQPFHLASFLLPGGAKEFFKRQAQLEEEKQALHDVHYARTHTNAYIFMTDRPASFPPTITMGKSLTPGTKALTAREAYAQAKSDNYAHRNPNYSLLVTLPLVEDVLLPDGNTKHIGENLKITVPLLMIRPETQITISVPGTEYQIEGVGLGEQLEITKTYFSQPNKEVSPREIPQLVGKLVYDMTNSG